MFCREYVSNTNQIKGFEFKIFCVTIIIQQNGEMH